LLPERDPGSPAGLTVTVRSSDALSTLSFPVSLSTYTPSTLKLAVVLNAFAFPNVTVPGPLTFVHVVVIADGGFGRPSSVAVPLRFADAGNAIDWSDPALTTGGWFTGGPLVASVAPCRVTLLHWLNMAFTYPVTVTVCPGLPA